MNESNRLTLYIESGILPYRKKGNTIEVLLITNKKKTKWGIPKGIVESMFSASASACKEAYEEAGVKGELLKPAIGKYSIKKWDGICRVKVFVMEVNELFEKWPENILRKREWNSIEEAAAKIKNKKLRNIILGLPEFLEEN